MFFMTPETPYPARVRALRVRLLAQNIHVLRGLGGSLRVAPDQTTRGYEIC